MEVRMVLVSRLSQANGHRETRVWATETVLSGLAFRSKSKAMFRVSGSGIPPPPKENVTVRTGCWAVTRKAMKGKRKLESHLTPVNN